MRGKLILLLIIWLLSISVMFIMSKLTPPIASLIYWIILGIFIFTVWLFKLSSKIILLVSFTLFIVAGLLATFSFTTLAEVIMRLSLLGWLIGFSQAVFEYSYIKDLK